MTTDASILFLRMLSRGAVDLEGVQAEFARMTANERRDGIHDAHSMLELLGGYFRERGLLDAEERMASNFIEWLCIAELPLQDLKPDLIAQRRQELFDQYFGAGPSDV